MQGLSSHARQQRGRVNSERYDRQLLASGLELDIDPSWTPGLPLMSTCGLAHAMGNGGGLNNNDSGFDIVPCSGAEAPK
jgi:hypothetical protein